MILIRYRFISRVMFHYIFLQIYVAFVEEIFVLQKRKVLIYLLLLRRIINER